MTTFEDGPAKGKYLSLKRAAVFLRVVVDQRGKWDALDQLNDEPAADEKIYAYKVHGEVGMCHIHARGGRGGFYPIATYRVVPVQPDDAVMRDSARWTEWCHQQPEAQHG